MTLIAVLVTLFSPVRAQTPGESGDFAARFGIIGAANVAALDQLGAGWIQLPFSWAAIQPHSADDWRTDAVDAGLITAVIDSGRDVVGVIKDTPAWASESGQPHAVPDGLALPLDDPANLWARFVERLIAAYGPMGVHHWIIYDEPNVRVWEGRTGFAGEADDYARLLKVAYLSANAADPAAVIHLAAPNWWVDEAAGREPYLAWLLRVLKPDPDAAAQNFYFDVVTVRITDNSAAVRDELANARAILDAAAVGPRPIWLEISAQPDNAGGRSALAITPARAADFVVQASALGMAAGAERIAFAGLHHPRGGALSPASMMHDLERLPAFGAYRTVIDLFAPAQRVTHYTHLAAELIVVEGRDRDVYVMWAAREWPVLFSITSGMANEAATLITPHDPPTEIASQEIGWPAEFRVDVTPARPNANGFLTVAGSPVLLVLERDDAFVRVTSIQVNGEWVRLR